MQVQKILRIFSTLATYTWLWHQTLASVTFPNTSRLLILLSFFVSSSPKASGFFLAGRHISVASGWSSILSSCGSLPLPLSTLWNIFIRPRFCITHLVFNWQVLCPLLGQFLIAIFLLCLSWYGFNSTLTISVTFIVISNILPTLTLVSIPFKLLEIDFPCYQDHLCMVSQSSPDQLLWKTAFTCQF